MTKLVICFTFIWISSFQDGRPGTIAHHDVMEEIPTERGHIFIPFKRDTLQECRMWRKAFLGSLEKVEGYYLDCFRVQYEVPGIGKESL